MKLFQVIFMSMKIPPFYMTSESYKTSPSFPLALLRYNWHITLCKLKIQNVMIWYMYLLWNNYRNKVINTSVALHNYSFCGEYI